MAIKNYYVVLGVSRTESPGGIRAAFRDLAKRYHPDLAGAGTEQRFREIAEAYEVLSDPQRRRLYNESLRGTERRAVPAAEPLGAGSAWPEPEPLLREPRSLFRNYETIRSSVEEVYERFARNFTGRRISKAERLETIGVDVVLSPDEAVRGTIVPISVPVLLRCPACGGSGWDWSFPCIRCDRRGFLEAEETVEIELPPFLAPGTIIDVALRERGIRNVVLRVQVLWGRP